MNYQPKGVVSVITPWNYPLTLPVADAVPALLAGNAVVGGIRWAMSPARADHDSVA